MTESYDHAAIRRGFQVYQQVRSYCSWQLRMHCSWQLPGFVCSLQCLTLSYILGQSFTAPRLQLDCKVHQLLPGRMH
jgi:hypothetical protein